MVLLSCSGTGGGIHAKLANGAARHNCARASPPHNSVARHCADRGLQWDNSIGPRNALVGSCELTNIPPVGARKRPESWIPALSLAKWLRGAAMHRTRQSHPAFPF